MTPIYMGGNNENDRVASPESVLIHFKARVSSKGISGASQNISIFIHLPPKQPQKFRSVLLDGSKFGIVFSKKKKI